MGKETVYLGIDFGASNIKVIHYNGRVFKSIKINKNDYSGDELPNFLRYMSKKKDGGIEKILGIKAKKQLPFEPENIIWDTKRKLYQPDFSVFVPVLNRELGTDEAIFDVFEVLKSRLPFRAEQDIHVVLTVPVNFSAVQIKRLRGSAEKAGFKVEGVISESFASFFSLKEPEGERLVCILDFGGSTMDVSVIEVRNDKEGQEIKELAASGMRLGGLDIDQLIFDKILMPKYGAEIDVLHDNLEASRGAVRAEVENAKLLIFSDDEEEEETDIIRENWRLSRSDVLEMLDRENIPGRVRAMLDHLFGQLQDSQGLGPEDMDSIHVFGGLSRMAYFRRLLEDYFTPDKFSAEDFDEEDVDAFIPGLESRYMAVAGGAARYLHHLQTAGDKISIENIIPFQLGFMLNDEFHLGLAKNSPTDFESPFRKLPWAELESCGWRLPIYQRFATPEDNELIFMGFLSLDRAKYRQDEPALLKMSMSKEGELRLKTYQYNAAADSMDCIEEHSLQIGE